MNETAKREFKSRLFGEFARLGKALASAHRLQLIEVLAQGERTVEDLVADTGLPLATVSQHLQVLRSARMVTVRKDGLYANYSLANPLVFKAWQALRELGQAQLAEVNAVATEYLGRRDQMDAVTATELKRRLREGGVIVLDVRSRPEFEAGHIAGAISIPIKELARRLRDLPLDTEIVAYCRGPYCVFADEAVASLRGKGYRAVRLTEGFPDWQARGFQIELGRGGEK